MNQLKTDNTGGMPVRLDDLRWMTTGIQDALKGLASVVAEGINQFILSGCESTLSGGNYTITEGYMYHFGEIVYCPAQVVADTSATHHYFDLQLTYDATGLKTFKDGNAHDTYQIRRMQFVQASSLPAGYVEMGNLETYERMLFHLLGFLDLVDWTSISGTSYAVTKPEGSLKVMRDELGFVHFKGAWTKASSITSQTLGTLGSAFIPSAEFSFQMYDASYDVHYTMTIKTTGEIILTTPSAIDGYIRGAEFPAYKTS